MNFRKINNITGWMVCLIACATYILTAEATASLWDTGEFIASAYKLQLPHPPGAPLFVLLGRIFIIFFGDNPANAAFAVNTMSALVSGFTILFLFWTITHFTRKMFVSTGEVLTFSQTLTVMISGVVGALAYTFSDSFWFSAVEGEVYALSSFFTALVFWAMLKWEHADERAGDNQVARNHADRWIVFIFFMMGLSVGVHLLNLLTIPAVVMIYYFRRYKYSFSGAAWAFIIGCIITGLVQVIVIKSSILFAGKFDILFVNSFGLPFFTGFIFFLVLLSVLIWFGFKWADKNGWTFFRLSLWCIVFMLLGYSTYITTLVRSNANPSIDMNNVEDPMSLVYYLGRDQYGSQPLLYGPHFTADQVDEDGNGYYDYNEEGMKYGKGDKKYIELGKGFDPIYDKEDMMLFPRIWDVTDQQDHVRFYAQWLGKSQYQDQQTGRVKYEDPNYADNINWFFSYQMGHMYWRYFMWNFAGKQNDLQGYGNKRDGNWISGFSNVDNRILGNQEKLPDALKNDKANNKLYLIPFILGIFGCVYHFLKHQKDWFVNFLLFFFTGIAIVLYLNQPGNQPRERDYAYVGSFYAFAVWIGLAVASFVKLIKESKQVFSTTMLYGSLLTFVITAFSLTNFPGTDMLLTSLTVTALFAGIVGLIYYLLRIISKNGNKETVAVIAAGVICFSAPFLMASQEWDDHDRSKKTLARDNAKNYLESCAPNAILFTFGDNDTYPLWYAQEVENVRPDIRIINTSLLGIDWYINQLRYKVNQSDSIDVLWTPEQIRGNNRAYIRYAPPANISKENFYDLYDVMKNVVGVGETIESYPVKRFIIPIEKETLLANGTVNSNDSILSTFLFELPEKQSGLDRSQLMILNILASNNWKRPIYFTAPYGELGFGRFLRKDGLSYRLVPIKPEFPQQNWIVDKALQDVMMGGSSIRDNNLDFMYSNMMEKFSAGGADKKGVYFDEENRRHLMSIRGNFAELAGNMAEKGNKEKAKKLLERCETLIHPENLPYARPSRDNSHNIYSLIYLEAAYKAGMNELAEKVKLALEKDLKQQKSYYDYLKAEKEKLYQTVIQEDDVNNRLQVVLDAVIKHYIPANETPVGAQTK